MTFEGADVELGVEKRQKLKRNYLKERQTRKTRPEGEQEGEKEVQKEVKHAQKGLRDIDGASIKLRPSCDGSNICCRGQHTQDVIPGI